MLTMDIKGFGGQSWASRGRITWSATAAILAVVSACVSPAFGSNIAIFSSGCGSASGATSATLSNSCTSGGGVLSTSTVVKAVGGLDTLRLYLDFNATTEAGGVINGPGAGLGIAVSDIMTVSGGTGGGTLAFTWAVDGTLAAQGAFSSALIIETTLGPSYTIGTWRFCGPGSGDYPCSSSSTVNDSVSVTVPFEFGKPLPTYWSFRAGVGTFGMGSYSSAAGTVDFFNTARLRPLMVFDSAGTQLPGVTIVSDSGYSYSIAPASTVPDPGSSLLLLGIGLAGLRAWRRRRQ
jgi:hypothetical protein